MPALSCWGTSFIENYNFFVFDADGLILSFVTVVTGWRTVDYLLFLYAVGQWRVAWTLITGHALKDNNNVSHGYLWLFTISRSIQSSRFVSIFWIFIIIFAFTSLSKLINLIDVGCKWSLNGLDLILQFWLLNCKYNKWSWKEPNNIIFAIRLRGLRSTKKP